MNHQEAFKTGQSHINGIEGFWSFAKDWHRQTHGFDPDNFPLYLREYEFRLNHRRRAPKVTVTREAGEGCFVVPEWVLPIVSPPGLATKEAGARRQSGLPRPVLGVPVA